jgi:hypothetical protein
MNSSEPTPAGSTLAERTRIGVLRLLTGLFCGAVIYGVITTGNSLTAAVNEWRESAQSARNFHVTPRHVRVVTYAEQVRSESREASLDNIGVMPALPLDGSAAEPPGLFFHCLANRRLARVYEQATELGGGAAVARHVFDEHWKGLQTEMVKQLDQWSNGKAPRDGGQLHRYGHGTAAGVFLSMDLDTPETTLDRLDRWQALGEETHDRIQRIDFSQSGTNDPNVKPFLQNMDLWRRSLWGQLRFHGFPDPLFSINVLHRMANQRWGREQADALVPHVFRARVARDVTLHPWEVQIDRRDHLPYGGVSPASHRDPLGTYRVYRAGSLDHSQLKALVDMMRSAFDHRLRSDRL